jgi:MFS family permease
VIFFQEHGLSFTHIMLISAIEGLITFVFEIPAGILADVWGKKKTVLAGMLMGVAGLAAYVIHPSFAVFVIAEVLLGIGSAFESGAHTAIIYGKFEKHGIGEEFRSYITKKSRLMPIATAITVLSSSVLFSFNSYLPFYLSVVFMSLAFVLMCFVADDADDQATTTEDDADDSMKASLTASVRSGFLAVFKNKQLLTLSLCSAYLVTMYSNIAYLSQAYLLDLGFPIVLLGVFFFVYNLVSSLSASYSERLFKTFSMHRFLVLLLLMCIATALLSVQLLFVVIPLYLIFGFINDVISQTINSEIPSLTDEANRATVLSIVSFIQCFFGLFFEPFLGLIIDHVGISAMYLGLGVSSSLLVLSALAYLNIKRRPFVPTTQAR